MVVVGLSPPEEAGMGPGDGGAITTVTFEESGGKTLLVMSDLYPTKEALDEAIASGSTSGTGETFDQLDELVATLIGSGPSVPRSPPPQ